MTAWWAALKTDAEAQFDTDGLDNPVRRYYSEILFLADFDVGLVFCVVALDGCGVGAAIVDRNLLENAILIYRFAQEPQRCFSGRAWPSIGSPRGAGFIDSPARVFPRSLHLT